MFTMSRGFALFVCLTFASCAPRGPVRVSPAELARANQLVVSGCYRCLEEALTIYERQIAATAPKPLPALLQATLDTSTLLVVRAKELGIPSESTLEKLKTLAARTPVTAGHLSPDQMAQLADLAPPEPSGMDPEAAAALNRRDRREQIEQLRPLLSQLAAPSLAETYLALTHDCFNREARDRIAKSAAFASPTPLPLRFKLAVCTSRARSDLPAVREADQRWVDTAFFEGRAAITPRGPDLRSAIDFHSQAHTAFPESAAIFVALAHAQRGYGDLGPALVSYDGVLKMVPTLREALLGRVITLSYLDRIPESVETATRMIDLGTWLLGDAYYWRARGRYILKMLDDAWSDAEHAVKLAQNTNTYTLAGVIAYDRKELDTAKERFRLARVADASNCTAHAYFALVTATQNNWAEATPVFSTAMSCFVKAAETARVAIADLQGAPYDDVYKGRLIADQEKTLAESELKAAQNAYNAAQGWLREGNRPEAMTHLQIALEHPEMRGQAEALQKLLQR
jgi:tetratricopeptide (TPR) repeat protein